MHFSGSSPTARRPAILSSMFAFKAVGVGLVGGQGVPIGDEVIALVLMLQVLPILQRAQVIALIAGVPEERMPLSTCVAPCEPLRRVSSAGSGRCLGSKRTDHLLDRPATHEQHEQDDEPIGFQLADGNRLATEATPRSSTRAPSNGGTGSRLKIAKRR